LQSAIGAPDFDRSNGRGEAQRFAAAQGLRSPHHRRARVAPIVIANFVALRVDSPASKSTPSRERVARMPPL